MHFSTCTLCNTLIVGSTDYDIESLLLTFEEGTDLRECTTFTAINDSILEPTEGFSISLDTDAVHSSQSAIITIIDNDGVFVVCMDRAY